MYYLILVKEINEKKKNNRKFFEKNTFKLKKTFIFAFKFIIVGLC